MTPEESIARIAARGRECESGISKEYLEQLYNAYEKFISEISRVIPVIKVNYSEFHDVDQMAEMIKEEYAKLCNVRLVEFASK